MTQKVYNVIMDNPFTEHRLDNGLRIVMEVMPGVTSAAAGFLARTGARDETPELAGVSHFLEHMCFKGTPHRTWRQITIDFDEMGSSYNAFTGKDRTFYYGWVPSNSIDRQIALLADMMESTLPTDEFDMERNVVLEEIAMSNDQIENLAYDLIHEKIYGGHPLAHPVLGYDQTIRNLTRDRMWEYLKRRYAPDNLILIAAGKIAPQQIIADAERSCGHWRPAGSPTDRRLPSFAPGAT